MTALTDLLDLRGYLILDGAMGTQLFEAGLTAGEAPELWSLDNPEEVQAIHRSYVQAGSDILLTNTFGGNRHRLKLHRLQGQVAELNAAAVANARVAADETDRTVLVAGSMGPTGELIEPLGTLSVAETEDAFAEQAAGPQRHPQRGEVGQQRGVGHCRVLDRPVPRHQIDGKEKSGQGQQASRSAGARAFFCFSRGGKQHQPHERQREEHPVKTNRRRAKTLVQRQLGEHRRKADCQRAADQRNCWCCSITHRRQRRERGCGARDLPTRGTWPSGVDSGERDGVAAIFFAAMCRLGLGALAWGGVCPGAK